MINVCIIFDSPAGTVRIIKDVWRQVGLNLAVENQILERFHPTDLLGAPIRAQAT